MSSELKSANLEVEDLSKEILACEKKVYETFLGPKPDVESLQKLLLPDYLYIQSKGVIWTREVINQRFALRGDVASNLGVSVPTLY